MKRALIFILIALALVGAFLLGRLPLGGSPPVAREEPAPPSDEESRAWERVHATPSDPSAWAALGDAEAAEGDLVGAEHAYLTAIRMGGDNGLAYARLGFLHYARQEDDRALALLMEAKRRGADVPMLDFTIDALKAKNAEAAPIEEGEVKHVADAGVDAPDATEVDAAEPPPIEEPEVAHVEAPPEPPPPPPQYDVCSIPARRIEQGRTFVAQVAVYGHWADLIIDTGASITVLTRAYADAVGLPLDPNGAIQAITANGRVQFGTAIVPEVVLGDRVAQNVRVAVCDGCVESVADGLLGLDLVAAFGLRLDLANETIHFADCE